MQLRVKEITVRLTVQQEVDMQYIDPRHAAFLWDAVEALQPNQNVHCTLPERPNERWRIRYMGIGRGGPSVELNHFDEEDHIDLGFCFLLVSRRRALLLSFYGYQPHRDEMYREELVTLSGSGLATICDLGKHATSTQLVNVTFGGAKWLREQGLGV
jgi:hypothetical protein